MGAIHYILRRDDKELACHSTRLAATIEAIERKLAVRDKWGVYFVDGVWIEPVRAEDAYRQGDIFLQAEREPKGVQTSIFGESAA